MPDNYNIGNAQGSIALEADIEAVGPAATRASVILLAGTASGTAVAHSNDASGAIPEQPIGTGPKLKGLRLSVFTRVGLIGSTPNERAQESANVTATCTLDGGDAGVETFNAPVKNYNDPHVDLIFLIDLQ